LGIFDDLPNGRRFEPASQPLWMLAGQEVSGCHKTEITKPVPGGGLMVASALGTLVPSGLETRPAPKKAGRAPSLSQLNRSFIILSSLLHGRRARAVDLPARLARHSKASSVKGATLSGKPARRIVGKNSNLV
jgi:hypothetical protein